MTVLGFTDNSTASDRIASGLLTPGEQLPTVRSLAVEVSVNPNTGIKACTELGSEGIPATEQGSGTFVGSQPAAPVPDENRQAKLESLCSEFLGNAARFGFSSQDVIQGIESLVKRRTPE